MPQMKGGIGPERTPTLGDLIRLARVSGSQGLEQTRIGTRKGIGPAQRTQGNVLGGPFTDPRNGLQGGQCGVDVCRRLEHELPRGDRLSQPMNRSGSCPMLEHLRYRLEWLASERGCRGKTPIHLGPWTVDRIAECRDQIRQAPRGLRHRDLLAHNGPNRDFKSIKGTRDAQALVTCRQRPQHLGDSLRPTGQIERPSDPAQHGGNHRGQRGAHPNREPSPPSRCHRLNLDPSRLRDAFGVRHDQSPTQASVTDRL